MGWFIGDDYSDRSFIEVTEWVRDHCEPEKAICHCGRDLRGDTVWGHPHRKGWFTNQGRMWLFIRCPKCRYEMALWKMGIPKDTDFWERYRIGDEEPAEART